jgi:hypothetical protein
VSAFQSSQVSVSTTATPLVSGLEGRFQIIVEVELNEQVWIGDSSVTTSTGYPLQFFTGGGGSVPDASLARVVLDVLLDSTDELYGIVSAGTAIVCVMVNPR